MSWIQKCCETYDNNLHIIGIQVEGQKASLAPLFCMTAKAQIEIALTEDGEFVSAVEVDKNHCETLIPVTEKSASRSGKSVFPHPLCDQLSYIALGHPSYAGSEDYKEYYAAYIEQLGKWACSPYSTFITAAVCRYCQSGTLLKDLSDSGVISLNASGLLEKGKVCGTDYEKCLVRWRVQALGRVGECWLNKELFDSYASFYAEEQNGGEELCYISGAAAPAAKGYPKGILRMSYGAKLISANDSSGFTYRGRFKEPSEAFAIGAVNSQKAHSALSWIAANQGLYYGPRAFVCWNPKGKSVPFDNDLTRFSEEDDEDDELIPNTMPQYAARLRNAIAGARERLGDNEDVVIMGMEAATTGRLSVTYYGELASSDYLNRLMDWQLTCCWYKGYKDKAGVYRTVISTPSIKDIVRYSYGTQQNEFVSADDNLLKEHSQRILHCIVDGSPLPYDIVNSITTKASRRLAYTPGNYEKLLSVACALIRKYKYDHAKTNNTKGDDRTMELDVNCTDRSYLFGRLLAIAEKVERSAYDKGEGREPAAMRLQSAFAAHPMHTWAILEKSLNPYYAKLRPGSRMFYRDLVGDIIAKLESTPMVKLNMPLEDTYLLGYYLQRRALKPKAEAADTAESIESETNE